MPSQPANQRWEKPIGKNLLALAGLCEEQEKMILDRQKWARVRSLAESMTQGVWAEDLPQPPDIAPDNESCSPQSGGAGTKAIIITHQTHEVSASAPGKLRQVMRYDGDDEEERSHENSLRNPLEMELQPAKQLARHQNGNQCPHGNAALCSRTVSPGGPEAESLSDRMVLAKPEQGSSAARPMQAMQEDPLQGDRQTPPGPPARFQWPIWSASPPWAPRSSTPRPGGAVREDTYPVGTQDVPSPAPAQGRPSGSWRFLQWNSMPQLPMDLDVGGPWFPHYDFEQSCWVCSLAPNFYNGIISQEDQLATCWQAEHPAEGVRLAFTTLSHHVDMDFQPCTAPSTDSNQDTPVAARDEQQCAPTSGPCLCHLYLESSQFPPGF
nr:LOW QUALITY PROTEIN: uncharacterized protein LOC123569375 [Macaca fascicularis]